MEQNTSAKKKAPLPVTHPELAAQWHPTKNHPLTPDAISRGLHKKVWWECPKAPDHDWQASIASRVFGHGCPFCTGRQPSSTNSLGLFHPQLASEWHPTRNGDLGPDSVVAGSKKKVWWKCERVPDHEWQPTPGARTGRGSGCPFCAGHKPSATNSLAALYPAIAKEWHPTRNGTLTPAHVASASNKKVWWNCPKGPDHEWQARPLNRTRGDTGCPFCSGQRVSVTNSLEARSPEIASQWHPTKNGTLIPADVAAGTTQRVWWKCPEGPDHEWEEQVRQRTRGIGCPHCAGYRLSVTNVLTEVASELAREWHPTKNGQLAPTAVIAGSTQRVWWKCSKGPDHEWEAQVRERVRGNGCPFCRGLQASVTNSLEARFPDIAAEWHRTRNGSLVPGRIVAGSNKPAWWQCRTHPEHEWQATVISRTHLRAGCPLCNRGWTIDAIRVFVASLRQHLHALTAAELYVLFQQAGVLRSAGRGRPFVDALVTGRFPDGEIDKFVRGEPSLVDELVSDASSASPTDGDPDRVDQVVDENVQEVERLPVIETKDALASLDHPLVSSVDEEAIQFLLASAATKFWKHAFRDECAAVAQARSFVGGEYATRVRYQCLDEYERATQMPIPLGYAFRVAGTPTDPNLMQRLAAVRVRDSKRVGNWSGTGAGKTLAAILASRVANAGLTVICCPNSVVPGWGEAILAAYPESVVITKTFEPKWSVDPRVVRRWPCYLVLNYETFQQRDSENRIAAFAAREKVDFVIVDEIHFTKQREAEDMSQRRRLVTVLIAKAGERNPDLRVLGMSATPVINNLQEGRSMVELVTGVAHDDLPTHPTVSNCMNMHQALVRLGIRWLPEYQMADEELQIPVDCGEHLEDIRALGDTGTPLRLEQILTKARLPVIREHVQPKTLIYTHYLEGVDKPLRDAIAEDGWKVGFYTGEDKSGLDGFLHGNIDVLIGSSAIGTGVDGLQEVCNRLIINVLPWTAAEYDQLKGRIYRQGQARDRVQVIIPLTYADVNGERWSWCESKMNRLRFKKSIADAAVDGVVPEGHLRTPAQAYQDVVKWLDRLERGEIETVTRDKITVPLRADDPTDVTRRRQRYGDFSRLNHRWNTSHSGTTHQRLRENPEEWEQYHTLYREARQTWSVLPDEEMIRWCKERSGKVVGDFGCGEARIAAAVSDAHGVYSFDHIGINDQVTVCDIAHVPLDDETLDVAIFCLSLMGSNFTDYLREAYRTLKLDGWLHIYEATSRFSDRAGFVADLKQLGFDIVSVEDVWKFTHIRAIKTGRTPDQSVRLRF